MAGLEVRPGAGAAAQLRAIALVRWRLFLNGLRRKGGKAELAASFVLYPVIGLMALGPSVGAGLGSYFAVQQNQPVLLSTVCWLVFGLWVLATAGAEAQGSPIDLTLLLRFPMTLGTYGLVRFFFGLLAPPNVVGLLALGAAALGIGIAEPRLFVWAAVVLFVYALAIILLLRVVLVWTDRWLAERRTREIFGVLFALVFVGFQGVNFWVQSWRFGGHPSAAGAARLAWALRVGRALQPVAGVLPPSLAGHAIVWMRAGAWGPAAGALASVLGFAVVFGWLFLVRLRGEFAGENFNEAPSRAGGGGTEAAKVGRGLGTGAFAACIEKELRYLTREPMLVLRMLLPLVFVALYAQRLGRISLLLPGALAYTMFAMLPMAYNVLGQDAAGLQLYLLSPAPLRVVFAAKNVVVGGLIVVFSALTAGLVTYSRRPEAPVAVATGLWFVMVLFLNLALGNYRSVRAATKVDAGKMQRRQQTSTLSMVMMMVILFGTLLVGAEVVFGAEQLGWPWAGPVLLGLGAAGAVGCYGWSLDRVEGWVLRYRDVLVESLVKTG